MVLGAVPIVTRMPSESLSATIKSQILVYHSLKEGGLGDFHIRAITHLAAKNSNEINPLVKIGIAFFSQISKRHIKNCFFKDRSHNDWI